MRERLQTLRDDMERAGCEAYFSISPPDNQYLSGFLTSFLEVSSVIIVTPGDALFLTDSRFTEQANEQVGGYEIREIKGDRLKRSGEILSKMDLPKVMFNSKGITVDELKRLQGEYTGEMVSNNTLVSDRRESKSAEEVEIIRGASRLAEGVLADVAPTLEEGLLERELAARFEYEFKKRGATAPSFDTIALFGARSSLPHGEPGARALKKGDIVLLDFGCRVDGYCSDLTRTYVFGTMPGAWFEEIYALTLEAQLSALDAVRPGAACRDVDAVARTIIGDGGYGDYFGHGLGHGVGVEIHESPSLSGPSESVLKPGMVVTVEPGIYLPGKGGVRIEDLVVVTEDGCEILSDSPKELKVLGA